MTDYKQLCADLLAWSEKTSSHYYTKPDVIIRARAALAEPEPEGPTDAKLLELMPENMRDEFSYAAQVCSDATVGLVKPGIFRLCLNTAALEYARVVLERWGNHAESPDSSTHIF